MLGQYAASYTKVLILESPRFWAGSIVLILLAANEVICKTGFESNYSLMYIFPAYIESAVLYVPLLHAVLGLKLGLAI